MDIRRKKREEGGERSAEGRVRKASDCSLLSAHSSLVNWFS
jgi:hypothetical protein